MTKIKFDEEKFLRAWRGDGEYDEDDIPEAVWKAVTVEGAKRLGTQVILTLEGDRRARILLKDHSGHFRKSDCTDEHAPLVCIYSKDNGIIAEDEFFLERMDYEGGETLSGRKKVIASIKAMLAEIAEYIDIHR